MIAETVMAILIALGSPPGRSLYSQVEVDEDAAPVAITDFTIGGKSFQAYDHFDASAPPSYCAQRLNPACRRVRRNEELKRFERPETFSEGLERYWMIANGIADNSASDVVAEFLTVIVLHESGLRRDVHAGENHRPFRRRTKHEDAGKSWCLGQVMIGRNPKLTVPWKGYETTQARELVGVTKGATDRCLGMVGSRVASIVRHCGKRGRAVTSACVFVGYAGTMIRPTHPLMKARMGTHQKLKRAPRKLHDNWRALLGLTDAS